MTHEFTGILSPEEESQLEGGLDTEEDRTFGTGASVPGTGGTVQINDDGTITQTRDNETVSTWDPGGDFGTGESIPGTGGTVTISDDGTVLTEESTGETVMITELGAGPIAHSLTNEEGKVGDVDLDPRQELTGLALLIALLVGGAILLSGLAKGFGRGLAG